MIKSDRSGKDWIKFSLLAVVMLLASDLFAKEKKNYQGLPAGDGIDLVLDNCTACHSTDIIQKNHPRLVGSSKSGFINIGYCS